MLAGWEVDSLGWLGRVARGGAGETLLWYVGEGFDTATVSCRFLIAAAISLVTASSSACFFFIGSRSSFSCVTTTSEIVLISSSLSCARFSKRVFVCSSINFLRSSKDILLPSTET